MKIKNRGNIAVSFVILVWVLYALGIIGWVINIIKLARCDFEAPYKCEIIHGIGVTPVGSITGWLNVGK